jgi:hypothetical protein
MRKRNSKRNLQRTFGQREKRLERRGQWEREDIKEKQRWKANDRKFSVFPPAFFFKVLGLSLGNPDIWESKRALGNTIQST